MSINSRLFKILLAGFFFILIIENVKSLPPGDSNSDEWKISLRGGTAILITESGNGFNFLENEFKHKPGLAYDMALSRTIGKHFEPGISLGVYTLSGTATEPSFSATGAFGPFNNLHDGIPVEYNNLSSSLLFFTRYHLFEERNEGIQFRPFFEFGGGLNVFTTEVAYESAPPGINDRTIFQKAGSNKGTVGQLSLGVGANIHIGSYFQFFTSFTADWVNYDCVDGVHNYSGGERIHAEAIVARLMAGIVIPITKDIYSNARKPLPWSP